jgi:hypothetical protein
MYLPPVRQAIHIAGRLSIILTQVSCNFTDFLDNWARSLRTVGHTRFVAIAEDNFSLTHLHQRYPGHGCLSPYASLRRAAPLCRYSTGVYADVVIERGFYLAHYLEQGYDVLYSDIDIVFFRDPLPLLALSDAVLTAASDQDAHGEPCACTGFLYVRADTPLQRKWATRFCHQWSASLKQRRGWNQPRFNELIQPWLRQNCTAQRLPIDPRSSRNTHHLCAGIATRHAAPPSPSSA